ncbi:MAG: hypothetical protein Ct9H300mP16_12880 [Pseudomonadota bacterium]|nr:MAG: hypothetical protein Ct9H300mP16_12880 [Pseudomonadota bacterium]
MAATICWRFYASGDRQQVGTGCPGAYEARIYAGNADLDIWHQLPASPARSAVWALTRSERSWPPGFLNRAVHAELGLAYRCVAEPHT